jgi:inhibitor of KinA
MNDWELIKRPSGVIILRFNLQFLEKEGRKILWGLAEFFRQRENWKDVVAGSSEIIFFEDPDIQFLLTDLMIEEQIVEIQKKNNIPKEHRLFIDLEGEDFEECVLHSKISKSEWIEQFCSTKFQVGLTGFLPYFSYLEGLPTSLHRPRRKVARTKVKQGALAIGGGYVGVYPEDTPGGWNIIGECLELEKIKNFNLGDSVRFSLKREEGESVRS